MKANKNRLAEEMLNGKNRIDGCEWRKIHKWNGDFGT